MTELAVHPVAALFPMLADDELEELAAGHQTPAPAWQDIKHLPLRGRTSNTCPCVAGHQTPAPAGRIGGRNPHAYIYHYHRPTFHRVENLLSLYRWLVCIAARPRIHSREPFDPAPKGNRRGPANDRRGAQRRRGPSVLRPGYDQSR